VLSSVDLQRPSDKHHEFWMFCTTRRTEEEMGRTCAHITSMSPCVSCVSAVCLFYCFYLIDFDRFICFYLLYLF